MSARLWVGGRPLDTVVPWQSLTWSNALSGGCMSASWTVAENARWSHSALRRGAPVEVRVGATAGWAGLMSEVEPGATEMHAAGLAPEAAEFAAVGADGKPARYVSSATEFAITRGLPWGASVPWGPGFPEHANPVSTEDGEELETLADLWGAAADASGFFWGVGPDRRPYAIPRPTAPRWQARVSAGALGVADDEYVTHLVGRYRTGAGRVTVIVGDDGSPGTPSHSWGRRERRVDLTDRGVMGGARATSILNGMLAKLLPRPGYTNTLEFGEWDVVTSGGAKASPLLIRPGDGVRLHGVREDGPTPRAYHDIVVDQVTVTAPRHGAVAVSVVPLGRVARDFDSVLTKAARRS